MEREGREGRDRKGREGWKGKGGMERETGKDEKNIFFLCKPLICCDDPVRW